MIKSLIIITIVCIIIHFIIYAYTAGFVFISTCDNQSTMLNDTMNCTHSRWLAARGLPNESYLVNYTMTRVKTSKTCFFECQSNPNCHAYLFQLNSSTVCTLYNKPVDRSVPRSNRTSYHFGTRACCNINNDFMVLVFCSPCDYCQNVTNCSAVRWIGRPGLPVRSFIANYTLAVVNTTKSCLDECQLNTQCFAYSHSLNLSTHCTLYNRTIKTGSNDPNILLSHAYATMDCCRRFSGDFLYC
uniref:Apple domain-containing protein n=1 Tax=Trichobilharzia regenti TaxID=157069 RepID=A0AA85K7H1_TRIRE|nr:unnamed protein product [Trichobilharzia regenti]